MNSNATTKVLPLSLWSWSVHYKTLAFACCRLSLYGICRFLKGRRRRSAESLGWDCCKFHLRMWSSTAVKPRLIDIRTCVCGFMRAYYATYVYYYTYDITWYAWYGWIWTALEAELGVICACAPALKGFFKRYFSMSTIRSGLYGSGKMNSTGRRTPAGIGKSSQGNSHGSQLDSVWEQEPVPLNRIQVSTETNIGVEDKDETASQGSSSSTRNLTALPIAVLPQMDRNDTIGSNRSIWAGNRTIITALRREREYDVEKHA